MSGKVKTVICLLMSLLLMFPLNAFAGAAATAEEQVQPYYSYTDMTYVSMIVSSDGAATCLADVEGYDGLTTKIYIKMTLQKYTVLWWSKVETWEITIHDFYGYLSRTTQVGSGTYRVKAEFTVYSGSSSEDITSYSQEYKFTKS